ncbi:MAG TPA: glycosyltransferase family 4 protein [Gemmatimonadales bacterium]|nr:glycosyltransferase family 4 protein [Gemmatimonadales bacterium]
MTAGMRVLMVTSDWLWNSWGGPAVFIARQAEFLRREGIDVDILPFRGARNPRNYYAAWKEVRRRVAVGRYDLVHAQFGQSGLTALPKSLPLVVTFRGDDLEGIIGESGRYIPSGRLLQFISREVARRADAVIVVSEHMKRYLPASVVPHVMPSGLDLELFRPEPRDTVRHRLGLPLDLRLVLFVGNPDLARKRYRLAQAAVDQVNRRIPTRLVVGWEMQHQQIAELMNACDALVVTSMQEGSPNSVKEALACNLPVVSVPVGDVPVRLQGVEGCELCADDKVETIAAALIRVLHRGGRIQGRAAVAALDEQLLTQQLIDIYRSILPASRHLEAQVEANLLIA